jgi:hypothetical protein
MQFFWEGGEVEKRIRLACDGAIENERIEDHALKRIR